jgi:hypothetical protein
LIRPEATFAVLSHDLLYMCMEFNTHALIMGNIRKILKQGCCVEAMHIYSRSWEATSKVVSH